MTKQSLLTPREVKQLCIEKLHKSLPIELTGEEYIGKYELNANSAQKWIKINLKGSYVILDTNETIELSTIGAEEVTSHSRNEEAHLKSIAAIPDIITNAIFIEELPNAKANGKFDSYRYYAIGIKMGEVDYTAKVVIGVKGNKKYYDHRLTAVEKGKLIDLLNQSVNNSFTTTGDLPFPSYADYGCKDTKLISILQIN